MAYRCPRCGEKVERGNSGTAQMTAGLIGALFYAAFGAFQCKNCGELSRDEFSEEDRKKMFYGSMGFVLAAVVLAVIVIWILVNMDL
jgi:predicted RNA-binding Zn-ribbon protein involved in translation (DUF1610 family)